MKKSIGIKLESNFATNDFLGVTGKLKQIMHFFRKYWNINVISIAQHEILIKPIESFCIVWSNMDIYSNIR